MTILSSYKIFIIKNVNKKIFSKTFSGLNDKKTIGYSDRTL